ncbi:MAG: chloride channel protein [Alphaproteobacteria bacterium]|nr:chloride channel protein [Alphaproteobacteria bacterium]
MIIQTSLFNMNFQRIANRLIFIREQYLGDRTYLIMASIVVGIVSSLAAVALKHFVHLVYAVSDHLITWSRTSLIYIISPLAGIILTILMIRLFFRGKFEKGLSGIIFSIVKRSGIIEKSKMYSHMLTSGLTIGFGGSAGLEAPIVITGSAIGSNIGGFMKFGSKEKILLLACGAASGIAAVFNSPIAGTIFAIEVLLADVSIPVFIPLLISTATATIVSKFLLRGQLFYLVTKDWYFDAIPYYVLLGVLCGLLSVYMTRMSLSIEGYFEKRKRILPKAVTGGIALGILIYIFPPLFGEGYRTIEMLFDGNFYDILNNSFFSSLPPKPYFLLTFTGLVILLKIVATSLTLGAGGNGGIFAPSLFTGAMVGFGTAFLLKTLGIADLHTVNFIAAGMAGIMAGVVHAPLTAIFLIAEITGGYVLFVPLMIVSALSYFISRYFEPYTIYTKNLARKGQYSVDDKLSNVFKHISVEEIIETEFIPLNKNATLGSLIDAFTRSKRNVFPVVDDDQKFIGIIPLESFKELIFRNELFETLRLDDLTIKNVVTIEINDSVDQAMLKFEESGLYNIPVTRNRKYVGFISRGNIMSYYKRILKSSSSFF